MGFDAFLGSGLYGSAAQSQGTTSFADDAFRVTDDGEVTAKIAFQASAISSGTTRTILMPDADVDLGSLGGGNEFVDDVFRIQDDGDNTKKVAFDASEITTGTTRTVTVPDYNVDLGEYVFICPVKTASTQATYTNLLSCGIPVTGDITSILFKTHKTFGVDAVNYWTWMPQIAVNGGADRDLLASAFSYQSIAVNSDDDALDMGTINASPGVVKGEQLKITATANGTPPNHFAGGGYMVITMKRTT